ncbi:BON domain-containing protein [Verminephrobacter aporrectodeae]|uniref:BON domain-containing protein n=1 Tax=Verminephrobacter aporrectodeae TaxID=1110389 RepID=UPI0022434ADF|nr:BON domain-containing protein [Verminephrobacter aporrectodeae]MCW8175151.1 BON domain-containing protein [Verminephrobacter aporrectodeae subsp. tuberculatae]MCW8202620.1 BON domain-containing protein [Verminephrobacter aporrectodeae subsp. tuberculatae]
MKPLKISVHPARRVASTLAVGAVALGLTACDKGSGVSQQLDSAVEKGEQAVADARTKAEDVMQNAQDQLEQGASSVRGTIDDVGITARVHVALAEDPELRAAEITVGTVNGKVTLDGKVPTTTVRDRAESIAKTVSGVASVDNQLIVLAG